MATNNEEELTVDDIIADFENKALERNTQNDKSELQEDTEESFIKGDIKAATDTGRAQYHGSGPLENGNISKDAVYGSSNNSEAVKKKKPNIFIRLLKGIIPWQGDSVGNVIRKLIFLVALILFLATAIPLLVDILSMVKDEQVSKQISQLYITPEEGEENYNISPEGELEILPAFDKLLEINPDTVGYLKIDGTVIDYPVVKTTDNDFYLDHDFYKNESRSGTIMMDYHNEVTSDGHSANMILYGHNMQVGTFFATLGEYWRTMYDQYPEGTKSFYKEHPVIRFDTLYERAEWKIFGFGIYNVAESRGEVFGYNMKYDFTSEDDFNDYIINIMDRSDIFTDVDLKYGDDILTLSTCYWPYENSGNTVRLAIFARKIREGESRTVNVNNVQVNTYVKRWQWVYDRISNGYDWSQSNWDRRKLLSYTAEDAERDNYTFPSTTD